MLFSLEFLTVHWMQEPIQNATVFQEHSIK